VVGHLGEARRNVARGRGNRGPRPEKTGSSEDLLEVSWADFCFTRGPAGAVMGIIRCGGADRSVAGRDPATASGVTSS
jgi:hypothetical protein